MMSTERAPTRAPAHRSIFDLDGVWLGNVEQLAEAGGGTAWVMEGLEDSKWMFDSLDVLPDWIADIIRKDGRGEGQYIRTRPTTDQPLWATPAGTSNRRA